MSDSDGNTARLEQSQKEDEWFNATGPGQPGSPEANEVSDSFIRRYAQLVWRRFPVSVPGTSTAFYTSEKGF